MWEDLPYDHDFELASSTTSAAAFGADRSPLMLRRQIANVAVIAVSALFAGAACLFLLYLIFYIARLGLPLINLAFFTQLPAPEGTPGGGVAQAIVGSLIMVGLAAAIGIPLGMATRHLSLRVWPRSTRLHHPIPCGHPDRPPHDHLRPVRVCVDRYTPAVLQRVGRWRGTQPSL